MPRYRLRLSGMCKKYVEVEASCPEDVEHKFRAGMLSTADVSDWELDSMADWPVDLVDVEEVESDG